MAKSKFQKGDRVWSPAHGDGVVTGTEGGNPMYPIYVAFDEGYSDCYTVDGKDYYKHTRPSLFHGGSYIVEAPEPQRKYIPKKGELVAVANPSVNEFCPQWYARVFKHIDEHGHYCTIDGDINPDLTFVRRWFLCEPIHNHFTIPAKEEDA